LPFPDLVIPLAITCELESTTVCLNRSARLRCGYDLTQRLDNGQLKYISSNPVWQINGQNINPSDSRFITYPGTEYAAWLEIVNVTGPMAFSCFLVLNDGFGGLGGSAISDLADVSPDNNITQLGLLSMETSINSIIITLSYSARCFPIDALLAEIDVSNVKRDTFRIGERITVSDLNRGTLYEVNVTIVAVGSQRIRSTPLPFTAQTKLLSGVEIAVIVIVICVICIITTLVAVTLIIYYKKRRFHNSRKTKSVVAAVETEYSKEYKTHNIV
jgi:hypothetical protein